MAEGEGAAKLSCYRYSAAVVSGRLATASQQVHWRRRQRDHWQMHRAQPCSGILFMQHMPYIWFDYLIQFNTETKHFNLQIVKILNSYTPIDDFEKRVTSSFVRKVQVSLIVSFNTHFVFTVYCHEMLDSMGRVSSCCSLYCKIGTGPPHSWCWTQTIGSRSRFLTARPRRLWSCCRSRAAFTWAF